MNMMDAVWTDRKRIFGMPISFTKYALYEDKIVHTEGFMLMKEGEVMLYRILDVEIRYTLLDRILGVGTIVLFSGDVTNAEFKIEHIKNPRMVLDMINERIEFERSKLGIKGRELFGVAGTI